MNVAIAVFCSMLVRHNHFFALGCSFQGSYWRHGCLSGVLRRWAFFASAWSAAVGGESSIRWWRVGSCFFALGRGGWSLRFGFRNWIDLVCWWYFIPPHARQPPAINGEPELNCSTHSHSYSQFYHPQTSNISSPSYSSPHWSLA